MDYIYIYIYIYIYMYMYVHTRSLTDIEYYLFINIANLYLKCEHIFG